MTIKWTLVLLAILALLGFGYYVYDLQNTVRSLEKRQGQMEQTIKSQAKSIEDASEAVKALEGLSKDFATARATVPRTVAKLAEVKKLTNDAEATDRLNKDTKDLLRCLELQSGSPKTNNEKNSLCPELLR